MPQIKPLCKRDAQKLSPQLEKAFRSWLRRNVLKYRKHTPSKLANFSVLLYNAREVITKFIKFLVRFRFDFHYNYLNLSLTYCKFDWLTGSTSRIRLVHDLLTVAVVELKSESR